MVRLTGGAGKGSVSLRNRAANHLLILNYLDLAAVQQCTCIQNDCFCSSALLS